MVDKTCLTGESDSMPKFPNREDMSIVDDIEDEKDIGGGSAGGVGDAGIR